MPSAHWAEFRPCHPFPDEIIEQAVKELENLTTILQKEGIQVHRPNLVNWGKIGGYTAAMPRDALLVVGETVIESCYAWSCRRREVELAFEHILDELQRDPRVSVIRAPKWEHDPIYDGELASNTMGVIEHGTWAISNARPAFDAADFMRFGQVILGQLSNVTNPSGIEYVRKALPVGYDLEILDVDDPHAMHIDATILPLRPGLLVFNPSRVTEASLRRHSFLSTWRLVPYPFQPESPRGWPPLFMTSPWIVLNVLSLDEERVVVEAGEEKMAQWLEDLGMRPIRCPFRHVISLGGSFHCATVDLVRA